MLLDEEESSWEFIETNSIINSGAFADAALLGLQKKRPFQALSNLLEGVKWVSLGAMASSDSRTYGLEKEQFAPILRGVDTVHGALAIEGTITTIEARLAQKDEETLAAMRENTTGRLRRTELDQYSRITTQVLHKIFYESALLPCSCVHRTEPLNMTQYHICTLQLDGRWRVAGDHNFCFFDSFTAFDDSYEWRKIQFRVPK